MIKNREINRYLLILIVILFSACGTTKYVEVPVEKVKIEYKDKLVVDSIYVEKNTDTKTKNDTVFITNYKYEYKYKYITDTIERIDTIPLILILEVVKEVNRLKNWLIVLMILGGVSIGGAIGFIFKKLRIL